MASKTQPPVGSAGWIAAEKENIQQLLNQELEDIVYPAQHEMEWLNEHMAEVFSKNQFNVTEIFKTPGKLRGKTPRTARKRNPMESRAPLTDIFSSQQTAPSPISETHFNREISKMSIAKDPISVAFPQEPPPPPKPMPVTDSGYHGMTEDEMDVDYEDNELSIMVVEQPELEEPETQNIARPSEGPSTSAASFHSAQERVQEKHEVEELRIAELEHVIEPEPTQPMDVSSPFEVLDTAADKALTTHESPTPETKTDINPDNEFEDDIGSPSEASEASTPDRPIVRKSSLTFASLPARDPLPTKKSMGARTSRTSHIDLPKSAAATRTSYFSRPTSGPRVTQTLFDRDDDEMDLDSHKADLDSVQSSDVESKTTKIHNMSSTQRLHEKINMLGKSQPSRPTKSIPSVAALVNSQPTYPELPTAKPETEVATSAHSKLTAAEDDDEWIRPLGSPRAQRPNLQKSHTADVMEQVSGKDSIGGLQDKDTVLEAKNMRSPLRPSPSRRVNPAGYGHKKAASVTEILTPSKRDMGPGLTRQHTVAVANPATSTTPTGSPKRGMDGPLSASKSKLQSIMKSAKGLFSSSAGVSAAAKMEALSSPTAARHAEKTGSPGYPSLEGLFENPNQQQNPVDSPPKDIRRTRSSTEKDEKRKQQATKDRQNADEQLENVREKQGQVFTQPTQAQAKPRPESKLARPPTRTSPRRAAEEKAADRDAGQSSETEQRMAGQGSQQSQSQKEVRRPVKPVRDTVQKSKPQPVSIRVGTLSQRIPLSTANLASGLQESLPPPAPRTQPTLTKKASSSSINSSGSASQSLKTSVSSKPKALIAAEKKREQDEREAQRKLEQKREIERRRAAQQEEARRQEQKRIENERKERERAAAEDPKKLAQKQAIEKRRLENARKMEQQRGQPANDLASVLQQEKPSQNSQRGDLGVVRPPSRMNPASTLSRSVIGHPIPNPAKPPKRHVEEDAAPRPAPKSGGTYQQAEHKRRKTDEDAVVEQPVRPTMAPPIRQSNIRKDTIKPSIFPHGYTNAPAPPSIGQTALSLLKSMPSSSSSSHQIHPMSNNSQRVAHPMEMAKYANGKIPFADAPNPPSTKTPGTASRTLPKSSPHYPNGEHIHLPEIPTDSEDEDSDADNGSSFPIPKWAEGETLIRTLVEQDTMDADEVFGPIAPLRMEEIFRGNKDKMKRFRDRTSSANWAGPDGLTQEEIVKDARDRETMKRNGGWTFGL